MSPTDDVPRSRGQWLDWWFTPRWRALLTWVVLGSLTEAWLSGIGIVKVMGITDRIVSVVNHYSPIPIPGYFGLMAAVHFNRISLFWIEPLALRLNMWRSAAWFGLRIAPYLIDSYIIFVVRSAHYDGIWWVNFLISGALAIAALWGWRSRPWVGAIGAAMACGLALLIGTKSWGGIPCLRMVLLTMPYAAALLYGTRLLRSEERAERQVDFQTVPLHGGVALHAL